MLAGELLDNVRKPLNDPSKITWSDPDLIGFLNQALKMLMGIRPDAVSTNAVLTLSEGSEQTLPAGGLRLLSVFCNVNALGALIGPAIRNIDKLSLDDVMASWITANPRPSVHEYWYDERNPRLFWTNPVVAGTKIRAYYSVSPAEITSVSDALPVEDSLSSALEEWMLYLAWRGDDEISPTGQRAGFHRSACFELLGYKASADMASSPKVSGK
jgi:hypothetical protein